MIEFDTLYIVMELASHGNLYNYLKETRGLLEWKHKWKLALQAAKAVEYLHSNGVLHTDIKSLNFLVRKYSILHYISNDNKK